MGEFRMPSLGADMDVGTVVEWRVRPGDEVHRGDIVALVDTEKSTIEVEVFEDGIVEELLVEPGAEVPVGTPLARIGAVAEAAAAGTAPAPPAAPAEAEAVREAEAVPEPETVPEPSRAAPPRAPSGGKRRRRAKPLAAPQPAPAGRSDGRVRASPLARRRAADAGIDLSTLRGSGPGGAVLAADLAAPTDADVQSAPTAEEHRPEPAVSGAAPGAEAEPGAEGSTAGAKDRQAAMRHAIAALMARSKREIPHYYVATTIDFGAARTWLDDQNARRGVGERLLPAVVLLKATALAAREAPHVNGFWDDGFQEPPAVHLGVAVSLRGGGLVAPAIHDADRMDLDGLMGALRDLVERARSGRLRSSEMSDPTITVSNLGDQGAEEVLGVIYPPQVGLVGFGRIVERPWAVDGMIGVRPVVRATFAGDHRASDGHDGARLLTTIDRLLQAPEAL